MVKVDINPEQYIFNSFATPSYKNFIGFVKRYLAPSMEMEFVEEDYYEELWNDIMTFQETHHQLPRGHSKSEIIHCWATIYFGVYQVINPFYNVKGKQKRIVQQLVSSSDWSATGELSDRIKHYMESHPVLASILPDMKDKRRNNNKKLELKNGSTIHFRSIKTKRGLHVDRICGDDYVTETSVLSDEETWNLAKGAILPMGTVKRAMVNISGTPLRHSDINMRIHRGDMGPEWHCVKKPAILDWEKHTLLSPKRFTWALLMKKRAEIGSMSFESEYMLNPIDDETSVIKRAWVEGCFDKTKGLHKNRAYFSEVYLGVDFAFSDRVTADKSVFLTLGFFDGKYYVLDYVTKKGMSGTEQLQFIKELHAIYKYDLMALEENSIKAILKEVRELGLPIKLFRTANIDERDKAVPNPDGVMSISKRNFVMRLGTVFENKEIVIPTMGEEAANKATDMLNECVSFALEEGKIVEIGLHPDIPIALGYALEIAKSGNFIFDM